MCILDNCVDKTPAEHFSRAVQLEAIKFMASSYVAGRTPEEIASDIRFTVSELAETAEHLLIDDHDDSAVLH